MSRFSDNLKHLRKEINFTQEELAKALNVTKSRINMYERGEREPNFEMLESIADYFNVDMNYLLGKTDIKHLEHQNNIFNKYDNIQPIKLKKVPLLGNIACGSPILAVENIEDYIDMDKGIHADFALRCKGDSMINARILDGDIVYIRKQDNIENGEIAAVLIDECTSVSEATLKRVYVYEDKIRLCAENPQYKDRVFFENDMNKVRILGKAVAFLSSVY